MTEPVKDQQMSSNENPLDDLSSEEQQALKQLAEKRADESVGRRDALKAGGALGLGALLGGGGAATAIDSADAQASSSDGDGDLGTSQDPVDVFADGVTANSVSTDELLNIADHIVGTTSELEAAFNNLSVGDTIWIETPSTPYRTTEWLDIDVDGVTVTAQSTHADDGQPLIKVADGANVGGIRVGHNSHCEHITIDGIGYHGNDQNQDQSVIKLHGIKVEDAADVQIVNNYVTRTSPYHVHNEGGSGIACWHTSTDVVIANNKIEDIGDRGIQTASQNVSVYGNRLSNGFDRAIALDIVEGKDGSTPAGYTGQSHGANNAAVVGNIAHDNTEGSIIGMSGGHQNEPNGELVIANNTAYGTHRRFVVTHTTTFSRVAITGNTVSGGSMTGIEIGGDTGASDDGDTTGGTEYITITGNTIKDYGEGGVVVGRDSKQATIGNNVIISPGGRGISLYARLSAAVGNVIEDPGDDGINSKGDDNTLGFNNVRNASRDGFRILGNDNIVVGNRTIGSANIGINDQGTGTVTNANHFGDPN